MFQINPVISSAPGKFKFVNTDCTHLRTILLVDDEHGTRILTRWFLNNFGFTVDSVRTAEEALSRFDARVHDLVITNNTTSGLSGAELAHIIKMRSPATPVIMFSNHPPEDNSCFDLVLQRPIHLMLLKEGIDQILARPSLGDQKSKTLGSDLLTAARK